VTNVSAEQFPTLRYFLGCYYHQSWDDLYVTPAGMIDALIAEDEPTTPPALKRELDALIAMNIESQPLLELLRTLNVGGYVNRANPYEQVIEWRDLLAARLGG